MKRINAEYNTCMYCEQSSLLSGGRISLCGRKGVVSLDYVCKRFILDPLKITFREKPELPSFNPEDFAV